jgi:Glycosyl hydrolase catalytic core/Secretion system C-terminal sorting domain
MKRIFILTWVLSLCHVLNAQLTVYANLNQQGSSGTCVVRTIYKDINMPSGLDNDIESITLKQGFMATLADKPDGTGEGFCYMATVSDLTVDLANVLRNKVSFIRVLPIANVKKKGVGWGDNVVVSAMNLSWKYDWGINDASTTTREYVPMAWGKGSAALANVDIVTAKTGITHYLAFNEPDNVGQANININEAATLYKNLLRTGLRMGSPACTEAQYRVWLSDFTILANQDTSRVDFVAIHWYDWGNWLSTSNANPDVNALFNRFKNHVIAAYNLYQKPIWVTEFNANKARPSAVQEAFMALALPWLDADPRVERYAYFFESNFLAVSGGVLTPIGRVYRDHVSANAHITNVFDKRAGATLVSVDENYDASFSVYPSVVTQNKVEVAFKAASEAAQIKIFNLNGQLMCNQNLQTGATAQTIDIAHFTEGVYVLTLQDNNRILSRKFIKQ